MERTLRRLREGGLLPSLMKPRFFATAAICCWCSYSAYALAQEDAASPGPDGAAQSDSFRVLREFAVTKHGDALLLPVTVAGREHLFLVDTGASLGTVDKSFKPLLGDRSRTVKVVTPAGIVEVDLFASPVATVGGFEAPRDLLVDVQDFTAMREASGHEIEGIVGMDFLSQHVCRIDFDKGVFQFLESAGPHPGKRATIIYRRHGLPFVIGATTTNPDELMNFQVDTGSLVYQGSIDSEIFTVLVNRGLIADIRESRSLTLAGETTQRIGRVKTIAIGGFSHSDLRFSESDYHILGLSYLARYVVTFDFPNSAAYLKQGESFDAPDVRDMSGLGMAKRGGKVEVGSVESGSAAEYAGVLVGDVISKCGSLDSREATLFELRRQLCKAGDAVPMVLVRDGIERHVTLRLATDVAASSE